MYEGPTCFYVCRAGHVSSYYRLVGAALRQIGCQHWLIVPAKPCGSSVRSLDDIEETIHRLGGEVAY